MTTLADYHRRLGGQQLYDIDDTEEGPYGSQFQTWKRTLPPTKREFVEREEGKARHCSSLLYRVNRPLWRLIGQALDAVVADRVEAAVGAGRLEARVVHRVYEGVRHPGGELRFGRVDAEGESEGVPVPVATIPRSVIDCDDVILSNRKVYGGVTLRQNPLMRGGVTPLSKSGRTVRRAWRYRAPPPPTIRIHTSSAGTVPEVRPRSETGGAEGGEAGEETTHPMQIWPRAAYVRDSRNSYLW